MTPTKKFSEERLRIEVTDNPEVIEVRWFGKSDQRNPNQFIVPIMQEVLKVGLDSKKQIVWNFVELDYMNSSTITPIIKSLEQAKRSSNRVRVLYNRAKKWQDLSFSALRIFETKDGRIEVAGV